MNVERLREVKAQILLKPKQFNMNYWFRSPEVYVSEATAVCINGHNPTKDCGTTACMAGWAMALYPKEAAPIVKVPEYEFSTQPSGSFEAKAGAAILGLTEDEARRLFFEDYWPTQYQDYANYDSEYVEFTDEFTLMDIANNAADRIEHFIQTEGKE